MFDTKAVTYYKENRSMLFLLPTALGFASQPVIAEDCRVLQDTCDGCTETGPGGNFISFLNLDQFKAKWDEGGSIVDERSRPYSQSAAN